MTTTDENAPQDGQEPAQDGQDDPGTTQDTPDAPEDGDTFPRDYVERLRDESARYRQRAARADDLAAALWLARVESTGRLADPTDLPMPDDADPLDDDTVTTALDELLDRKPHLASRKPRGDIGQGITGSADDVDLAGILRAQA